MTVPHGFFDIGQYVCYKNVVYMVADYGGSLEETTWVALQNPTGFGKIVLSGTLDEIGPSYCMIPKGECSNCNQVERISPNDYLCWTCRGAVYPV